MWKSLQNHGSPEFSPQRGCGNQHSVINSSVENFSGAKHITFSTGCLLQRLRKTSTPKSFLPPDPMPIAVRETAGKLVEEMKLLLYNFCYVAHPFAQ